MPTNSKAKGSVPISVDPLYLKVLVFQANNLSVETSEVSRNIFASVSFNGTTSTTDRVKTKGDPHWNQTFNFTLDTPCSCSTLTVTCWDKDSSGTKYLGETRINIIDIFSKSISNLKDKDIKYLVHDQKYFKLHSTQSHHSYIDGSINIGFTLYGFKPKKRSLKSILSLSKSKSQANLNSGNSSTASLRVSTNNQPPSPKEEEYMISTSDFKDRWNNWVQNVECKTTSRPNDQGFYPNSENNSKVLTDIHKSFELNYDALTKSPIDSADSQSPSPSSGMFNIMGLDIDNASQLSDASSFVSYASSLSSQSQHLSPSTNDVNFPINHENHSDNGFLKPPEPKGKKRNKKKKEPKKGSSYEFHSFRKVKGVVFLEILSAEDLPKFKNFTRTGFDMDPFVVVSFGKRTYRTSWRKHTLNPIFNERVAFEVLDEEVNFGIHLSVLDKDSFTFHDRVADTTILMKDIIDMSTNFLNPEVTLSSPTSDSNSELDDNSSINTIKSKAIRSGLLRKKIKPQKVLSSEEEGKFAKYSIPLEFHGANAEKYGGKYSPTLHIRCRFEPYDQLRRQLWRHLLKYYDVDDDNDFTYTELSAFLDLLGSTLPHQTLVKFFKKFNKDIETDSLSIDEVIDCLEELIIEKNKSLEDRDYSSKSLLTKDIEKADIIKIDQCPVCGKRRLSQREDLDIITHMAICGSKDKSSVEKLIKSTYVSPSYATKRWYSKVFINLGYGRVQLGKNNANILVQDRTTGIIMEEKISAYVRIGIRILYTSSKTIQKKRLRSLLKKLTIKQGKYYDSPQSAAEIKNFIKFHDLDISECLLSINEYKTFNQFFYRKLIDGARPIEAPDDPNIITSAADSRCTAFNSIATATKIWIKGKGFTVEKLFAGQHEELLPLFAKNCSIAIFRLAPQDYHRFHSPVEGIIGEPKFIEGEYYTVNPMAVRSYLDVFGENVRCIIPIETKQFGTVVVIPVGAMMVGATVLTIKKGDEVKRGDELGYFKFGGSTILVLFQPNKILFDSDLVSNSMLKGGVETLVKVGMSIGHSSYTKELKREKRDFSKEPEHVKLKIIRTLTGVSANNTMLDDISTLSWEASRIKIDQNDAEWGDMLGNNDFENDESDDD